jgi:hypothetical protein
MDLERAGAQLDLWNRIKASIAPRMATQKPSAGKETAFKQAVSFQGFQSVAGTRRLESAGVPDQW